MDVNRTPLTEAEQDWIDKYRAALDSTPAPSSRLRWVRNNLRSARRSFAAVMKKIFGSREDGIQRKPVRSSTASSDLSVANVVPGPPLQLRKPTAENSILPHKKRSKRGNKAS